MALLPRVKAAVVVGTAAVLLGNATPALAADLVLGEQTFSNNCGEEMLPIQRETWLGSLPLAPPLQEVAAGLLLLGTCNSKRLCRHPAAAARPDPQPCPAPAACERRRRREHERQRHQNLAASSRTQLGGAAGSTA